MSSFLKVTSGRSLVSALAVMAVMAGPALAQQSDPPPAAPQSAPQLDPEGNVRAWSYTSRTTGKTTTNCLASSLSPRNSDGLGELELTSSCEEVQTVSARICVPGAEDIVTTGDLKGHGTAAYQFDMPEGVTARVRLARCTGEGCTAVPPKACN